MGLDSTCSRKSKKQFISKLQCERIRGILKIFRKYIWTTDLKTDGMRRREKWIKPHPGLQPGLAWNTGSRVQDELQDAETKSEFSLTLAGFEMPVTHLKNLYNDCLLMSLRHRVCTGFLNLGNNCAKLVTAAMPAEKRGCREMREARLQTRVRIISRSAFKKQEEGYGHNGEGVCVKHYLHPQCVSSGMLSCLTLPSWNKQIAISSKMHSGLSKSYMSKVIRVGWNLGETGLQECRKEKSLRRTKDQESLYCRHVN